MSHFRPVFDAADACAGHLIRTAKGWRAFDRQDIELGIFETEREAARLLASIADADAGRLMEFDPNTASSNQLAHPAYAAYPNASG
jgi:hypothetical protein